MEVVYSLHFIHTCNVKVSLEINQLSIIILFDFLIWNAGVQANIIDPMLCRNSGMVTQSEAEQKWFSLCMMYCTLYLITQTA